MFWRMVFGTLIRQRKKMFMIAFTVALGVSLATGMLNVMLGVGDKVNKELKTYGANINVVSKDASLISDLYELENSETATNDKYLKEEDLPKIKQIFWGFSIVDFTPYLEKTAKVNNQKTKFIGTWFAKHMDLSTGEQIDTGMKNLKNWWKINGEWLNEDDNDSVMVGSLFAGKNGIKVGDKIEVNSGKNTKVYNVKGIFESGGNEDLNIFSTLKTAQELYEVEGKISNIEVSALTTPDNELAKKATRDPNSLTPTEYETWYCTAYVSSICYQIQEVVEDSVAKPIRQVAESEGRILDKTKLLMILITALGSVGSALGISNLVTATVMEKKSRNWTYKSNWRFQFKNNVTYIDRNSHNWNFWWYNWVLYRTWIYSNYWYYCIWFIYRTCCYGYSDRYCFGNRSFFNRKYSSYTLFIQT